MCAQLLTTYPSARALHPSAPALLERFSSETVNTTFLLLLATFEAAIPWTGVVRRSRASARKASGGTWDGLLLLASLVLSLFSASLLVTAAVRLRRETAALQTSLTVTAQIERCGVATARTGGRTPDPAHELTCALRSGTGDDSVRDTVTAGYPASAAGYERWMDEHPPGTTIQLRRNAGSLALIGFEALVPSTRTAHHAASRALTFATAAALLFGLSRLLARS